MARSGKSGARSWGTAVAAALVGLWLGGCGETLVDHRGESFYVRPDGGEALSCGAEAVVCQVAGVATCVTEDATHCGASCSDCTAQSAPANAKMACVRDDPGASGQCGYECLGGLQPCTSGCCKATAVAAGEAHVCALLESGQVRCWGRNESGQVGRAPGGPRPFAFSLTLSGVAAVGVGSAHSCAVTSGGAVLCWGANASGQATGTPSAAPVIAPSATPVTSGALAVAGGEAHTCALLQSGAVRCWGSDAAGQLGGGMPLASGATALSVGLRHSCALVGSSVSCWGDNAQAQLGRGTVGGTFPTPAVAATGVASLSAGQTHVCVASGLDLDDSVRCWGSAPGSVFGLAEPQSAPAVPKRGTRSTIRFAVSAVAAGKSHTCVLRSGEDVSCFGPASAAGQLGGVPVEPAEAVAVPASLGAKQLAAGGDFTCAVFSNGGVRCWGDNASGQLGDGTLSARAPGTVVEVVGR